MNFSLKLLCLMVSLSVCVGATNRTPLLRPYLQTDMDGNSKSITNLNKAIATYGFQTANGVLSLTNNRLTIESTGVRSILDSDRLDFLSFYGPSNAWFKTSGMDVGTGHYFMYGSPTYGMGGEVVGILSQFWGESGAVLWLGSGTNSSDWKIKLSGTSGTIYSRSNYTANTTTTNLTTSKTYLSTDFSGTNGYVLQSGTGKTIVESTVILTNLIDRPEAQSYTNTLATTNFVINATNGPTDPFKLISRGASIGQVLKWDLTNWTPSDDLSAPPDGGIDEATATNIARYQAQIATNDLAAFIHTKANTNTPTLYNTTLLGPTVFGQEVDGLTVNELTVSGLLNFTTLGNIIFGFGTNAIINYVVTPVPTITFGAVLAGNGSGLTNLYETNVVNLTQSLTFLTNSIVDTNGLAWRTELVHATNNLDPFKLISQGASLGQVLKWNGSWYAPADDLSTPPDGGIDAETGTNISRYQALIATNTLWNSATQTFLRGVTGSGMATTSTNAGVVNVDVQQGQVRLDQITETEAAVGDVPMWGGVSFVPTQIQPSHIGQAAATDGMVMTWVTAEGQWEPQPPGASGITLSQLQSSTNITRTELVAIIATKADTNSPTIYSPTFYGLISGPQISIDVQTGVFTGTMFDGAFRGNGAEVDGLLRINMLGLETALDWITNAIAVKANTNSPTLYTPTFVGQTVADGLTLDSITGTHSSGWGINDTGDAQFSTITWGINEGGWAGILKSGNNLITANASNGFVNVQRIIPVEGLQGYVRAYEDTTWLYLDSPGQWLGMFNSPNLEWNAPLLAPSYIASGTGFTGNGAGLSNVIAMTALTLTNGAYWISNGVFHLDNVQNTSNAFYVSTVNAIFDTEYPIQARLDGSDIETGTVLPQYMGTNVIVTGTAVSTTYDAGTKTHTHTINTSGGTTDEVVTTTTTNHTVVDLWSIQAATKERIVLLITIAAEGSTAGITGFAQRYVTFSSAGGTIGAIQEDGGNFQGYSGSFSVEWATSGDTFYIRTVNPSSGTDPYTGGNHINWSLRIRVTRVTP